MSYVESLFCMFDLFIYLFIWSLYLFLFDSLVHRVLTYLAWFVYEYLWVRINLWSELIKVSTCWSNQNAVTSKTNGHVLKLSKKVTFCRNLFYVHKYRLWICNRCTSQCNTGNCMCILLPMWTVKREYRKPSRPYLLSCICTWCAACNVSV